MSQHNDETKVIRKVLATDLDGTLIPLPGSAENKTDLATLRKAHAAGAFELIYCTGRHLSSVLDAIVSQKLPEPRWMICDVGTSIYANRAGRFFPFDPYALHLQDLTVRASREEIESLLEGLPGLMRQQEDHQGDFKISYECAPELTEKLITRISRLLGDFDIPYAATGSVDPFLKCGLIDLLPVGVSKAYALRWLADFTAEPQRRLVYAGDSGNDFPALTAGWPAILVANASPGLAENVKADLRKKDLSHHFYQADKPATSGVLVGCVHYGLI